MYTQKSNNTAVGNLQLFGNVRVMVIAGLFVALSIVLGKFLQIPIGDSIRISLENLPLMMGGIFFGPFVGGAVGIVADLVGCILKGYAINPIITLGAFSIGFLSGYISTIMSKKNKSSVQTVFFSVITAHAVGSMLIKSIGLYIYFHKTILELSTRIPIYILIGTIETAIICMLLRNKAFANELNKVCNNVKV